MMKSTPGEVLERADVPTLAADDPPLEIVRRELDDGHGRLGRVTGRDALERVGDESTCAAASVRSRLLLHLPHLAGELVSHEVLRALDELLACLVHRQTRDLLERSERIALRVAELLLESLDVNLAIAEPLLLALDLGEPRVDLELLGEHALLDLRDLDAPILHLALDLASQRDGLLARVDLSLAPHGLGLALGIGEQPLAIRARDAHARARPRHEDDRRGDSSDDDSDECCAGREHGASAGGCRSPAGSPRVLSPGRRPARSPPDSARTTTSGGGASSVVGRSSTDWSGSSKMDSKSRIQKARACRKNVG